MTVRELIERIIYVAKCPKCGETLDVTTESPPRERFCTNCSEWVPYVEESWVGRKEWLTKATKLT